MLWVIHWTLLSYQLFIDINVCCLLLRCCAILHFATCLEQVTTLCTVGVSPANSLVGADTCRMWSMHKMSWICVICVISSLCFPTHSLQALWSVSELFNRNLLPSPCKFLHAHTTGCHVTLCCMSAVPVLKRNV